MFTREEKTQIEMALSSRKDRVKNIIKMANDLDMENLEQTYKNDLISIEKAMEKVKKNLPI